MEVMEQFDSVWAGHLGQIVVAKHRIILNPSDASSTHSVPHRAEPMKWKLGREQVVKLQKASVAEPAMTKWASPVVFLPKEGGSLRFGINYRRLNIDTERDSYHSPRTDECKDSLREKQVFSALDVKSGY